MLVWPPETSGDGGMAEKSGLEGIEFSDLQYIALAEILSPPERDPEEIDATLNEPPAISQA